MLDSACRVPDRIAHAIIAESTRLSGEDDDLIVLLPEGVELALVRDRPRYVNQWLTYRVG